MKKIDGNVEKFKAEFEMDMNKKIVTKIHEYEVEIERMFKV